MDTSSSPKGGGKAALSEKTQLDWLQLSRTENVGPITFMQLKAHFGSVQAALEGLPEMAARGGKKTLRLYPRKIVERELAQLKKLRGRLLLIDDPHYPAHLASISDPPPVLRIIGNVEMLSKRCFAVVGGRNASLNGRKFAHKMAQDMGYLGWILVSGLARGIDTATHQGALASGTVAVLATGLDRYYPPENKHIQKEIEEKGVVISEVPIGTPPQAQQFPRRNRMISGLSHGVIVLEAAMRSGSLITARFALEQGRDVFAVPGSPSDGRCEGSNDLIRQGGNVLTSVEDIINMYPDEKESPTSIKEMQKPSYPPPPALSSRERSKAHQMLLGNMSSSPIGVDELTRACHLSASEVSASLLELELAGRVTRPSGSHVSRLN
ncbi:MAG: DNA-protecting protein DprA [Alphaproteobacteria bacterium]|jgi:DNA processing protein|nr:DNA-protecting protein DprA [Alphaproteobacteria bacterium]MBT5390376.1 DNA-protecting protein DprA [Alphaproteobacteria bacterium]MBT5540364.1 DNA-protecting protein DprA [Alphaproteobacteria bacterium]MBT5654890.1 DNA-protecting protein DprA [Alphaproteobacteria bacterium]